MPHYVYLMKNVNHLIGKVVIEPITRIVTFYIHYETQEKLRLLEVLREFLTEKPEYQDIIETHALHNFHLDELHCCGSEPRRPSHLHIQLDSPINASSLGKLFSDIRDLQVNFTQVSRNFLQYMADYFQGEVTFISDKEAKRIQNSYRHDLSENFVYPTQKPYALELGEISVNFLAILSYITLLTAVPIAVERSLTLISQKTRLPYKAAALGKSISQFALTFYLLSSSYDLFGTLALSLLSANQEKMLGGHAVVNVGAMLFLWVQMSSSINLTTGLTSLLAVSASFLITKAAPSAINKVLGSCLGRPLPG